jgi:general secretion pathway protein I
VKRLRAVTPPRRVPAGDFLAGPRRGFPRFLPQGVPSLAARSPLGRRSVGFTLIEVLVALAIVAIGMAAVLGALTSSASTVLYMRDKTLAQWVALNHIAEQRLQNQAGQVPQTGKSDGDVDYAGSKWHWHQEIVATAVQGMVRLDVMVRPADSKADDDHGWYVTLSGIIGDAVAAPRGDMPLWGSGTTVPTPGQAGGLVPPGTAGTTPNGTGGTTPTTPGSLVAPPK